VTIQKIETLLRRSVRLAILLPILQLVLSAGSLAWSTLLVHSVAVQVEDPTTHQQHTERRYTATQEAAAGPGARGDVSLLTPLDLPVTRSSKPGGFAMVWIANLPGVFGEALVSFPTTWPDSWYPQFFDLFEWRAISWPIYALLFGWLIGRAIDALRGMSYRVRVWEALLLLAVSVFFFSLADYGVITRPIDAANALDPMAALSPWILASQLVWGSLCLLPTAAWLLQLRKRRLETNSPAEQIA
jgi:hypothetical protein